MTASAASNDPITHHLSPVTRYPRAIAFLLQPPPPAMVFALLCGFALVLAVGHVIGYRRHGAAFLQIEVDSFTPRRGEEEILSLGHAQARFLIPPLAVKVQGDAPFGRCLLQGRSLLDKRIGGGLHNVRASGTMQRVHRD